MLKTRAGLLDIIGIQSPGPSQNDTTAGFPVIKPSKNLPALTCNCIPRAVGAAQTFQGPHWPAQHSVVHQSDLMNSDGVLCNLNSLVSLYTRRGLTLCPSSATLSPTPAWPYDHQNINIQAGPEGPPRVNKNRFLPVLQRWQWSPALAG